MHLGILEAIPDRLFEGLNLHGNQGPCPLNRGQNDGPSRKVQQIDLQQAEFRSGAQGFPQGLFRQLHLQYLRVNGPRQKEPVQILSRDLAGRTGSTDILGECTADNQLDRQSELSAQHLLDAFHAFRRNNRRGAHGSQNVESALIDLMQRILQRSCGNLGEFVGNSRFDRVIQGAIVDHPHQRMGQYDRNRQETQRGNSEPSEKVPLGKGLDGGRHARRNEGARRNEKNGHEVGKKQQERSIGPQIGSHGQAKAAVGQRRHNGCGNGHPRQSRTEAFINHGIGSGKASKHGDQQVQ